MRLPYALAGWSILEIALTLVFAGRAKADEFWNCSFTESHIQTQGRSITLPMSLGFTLQSGISQIKIITPQKTVPISYSTVENTSARLAGSVQFDLGHGLTSTGEISLDKLSGRIRQSGHISDNSKHAVVTGMCSKQSN